MSWRVSVAALALGLAAASPGGSARLDEAPAPRCPGPPASAPQHRTPAAAPDSFSSSACCIAPNVEPPGRVTVRIDDMTDETTAAKVRRVLESLPGVGRVGIRSKHAVADIAFDEARTSVDAALGALRAAGLEAYRWPVCCELPPR